ncbi:unnamed protein product [Cuscuta europaea]|uniref:Uncharacterized protein n=1 Tax=Cuscuta europaea TaxID=41803 RepID=A0A9P0Z2Z6_CUSEU|nr:unnamed protein product [Cuscuta europaea]
MGKLTMLSLMFIIYAFIAFNCTSLEAFKLGPERQLIEVRNASQSDDTVRVDPLDRLKKYRGGYDLETYTTGVRLLLYPKGNNTAHLSLYLGVPDLPRLPKV